MTTQTQDDAFMKSFLNRIVMQPPQSGENKPLSQPFFSPEDGITGYTLCAPRSQDPFAAENFNVHILQVLPNEKSQLIIYPLFYLDHLTPFLDTIFKKEGQHLLFGKKFEGIGKQLLVENGGISYHIENNGDGVTKLYASKDDTIKSIKINNINSFIKLLEDVDRHADKYLEQLEKEHGRNIKKEKENIDKLGEK